MTAIPKTAVIGAFGQAGRYLYDAYKTQDPAVIGTDWKSRGGHRFLDLADPDSSKLGLADHGVTWAAVPAFIRQFERCENEPEFTRKRNVEGMLTLFRQLTQMNIRIAFFSSDGVFDGKKGDYVETDVPNPVNEYGRQKLAVEKELLAMTKGRCLILRVARIIGVQKGDGTLLDQIAQDLLAGKSVVAARDQIFSTILLNDIPRVLMRLQQAGFNGVIHVAGPEAMSRLEIATRLRRELNAPENLVREIGLDDINDNVTRPKNLTLRCDLLKRVLGFPLTGLSTSIHDVAENYRLANKERING